MVTFAFGQLIPSPKLAAQNAALIEGWKAEGFFVVGAEITDANLAAMIDINVDPQHTEKLAVSALKKTYLEGVKIPEGTEKVALCYYRPDPDACGTLGLLVELLNAGNLAAVDGAKIDLVDEVDNPKTTDWEARPIRDDVAPQVSDYHALSELYRSKTLSPQDKVLTTLRWLKGEDVTADLASASVGALQNKQLLGDALKAGAANITITPSGVVVFKGPGVGGSAFAYKFGPVAVLYDEAGFSNSGLPKWSICQMALGYADFSQIQQELNALEGCGGGTWGNSLTFIGSPQGAVSTIPEEKILEVVQSHLLPKLGEAVAANAVQIKANLEFARNLAAG